MNRKAIILLAMLVLGIGVMFMLPSNDKDTVPKAARGLEAPDFSLKDIDGKTWKLSDLRGRVVLLHFWATWCDTCKEENPTIKRLMELEKDNPRFTVLTVLFRDKAANAADYRKTSGLAAPVLMDDQGVAASYGLTGVPESFIIDAKGIIRDKVVGPLKWDTPEARDRLHKIIGAS